MPVNMGLLEPVCAVQTVASCVSFVWSAMENFTVALSREARGYLHLLKVHLKVKEGGRCLTIIKIIMIINLFKAGAT